MTTRHGGRGRAALATLAMAATLAAPLLLATPGASRAETRTRGGADEPFRRPAAGTRPEVSRPGAPRAEATRPGTIGTPRIGDPTGAAPPPSVPRVIDAGIVSGAARAQTPPRQIATYPYDGQTYVPPNAELYVVFDRPTAKSGSFSVADVDSNADVGGTLLLLNSPRWSALGDTVYLKPTFPMEFGHLHGMRVNTIFPAPPDTVVGNDLPIVFFRIAPRAALERLPKPNKFESVTLVPGVPTPVASGVRETNGSAVTFTSALVQFWASDQVPVGGSFTVVPIRALTVPVVARVPRFGVATLTADVTLPSDLARVNGGRLGLRIVYEGTDETGLPVAFDATSRTVVAAPGDTTLTIAPALSVPPVAGDVHVIGATVEWPMPGAALAAGDTLRPRAVVTGTGTGPFRAAFYMDGDLIGIEEGYMESGRPVAVTLRGPLPTRRFGEHRLQFVIESPQALAAQPVTFLCVPPANGLTARPGETAPPPDSAAAGQRLSVESTWLADATSASGGADAATVGWAAFRGRYQLAPGRRLEAVMTSRVRLDDTKNGSASPEQVSLRYVGNRATVEWGDGAPSIAAGAPLLASAVPRRGAQATVNAGGLGTLEGYVALNAHPRAAAGPLREARSDLYAARLTRNLARDRVTASVYGGYTHEDPTPGGVETATRARAIYGGTALVRLRGTWTLLGDAASVRHRTIEGVEPGRTRTGARAELNGTAAGFTARAEAFRYQPDLATALNPYALSDRKGFGADLSRAIAKWRFFGGYRTERPEETTTGAPDVKVNRLTFGGSLSLNQDSWVTPSIIRITQKGAQTDYKETRVATEFTQSEPLGGRTTARFDVGMIEDPMGLNTKRRVTSGSFVSTRREAANLTSTLTAGVEENRNRDLGARDLTVQGSIELRWEAIASRLLMAPFVSYVTRDYDLEGTSDRRLSVRLQFAVLRLPSLGDAALAVTGRVDRLWLRQPLSSHRTDTGIDLSLGKRIPLVP